MVRTYRLSPTASTSSASSASSASARSRIVVAAGRVRPGPAESVTADQPVVGEVDGKTFV